MKWFEKIGQSIRGADTPSSERKESDLHNATYIEERETWIHEQVKEAQEYYRKSTREKYELYEQQVRIAELVHRRFYKRMFQDGYCQNDWDIEMLMDMNVYPELSYLIERLEKVKAIATKMSTLMFEERKNHKLSEFSYHLESRWSWATELEMREFLRKEYDKR